MEHAADSTVLLVEQSALYQQFLRYFALVEDDISTATVLDTTHDDSDITLVSYSVPNGLEGYGDARLDFRVFDESNEFHNAEAVLTDYDDEGRITDTKTYTIRGGRVAQALYDS